MKQLLPLFILLCGATLAGQRVVEVPLGTAGALFETIEGDTTDAGERVDVNTIYELTSGTPYLVNGVLEYEGYNLTIRAAEDADVPPLIVQSGADDDAAGQLFRLRGGGNLTLEGIFLSGRATGGGVNDRIVRINTDAATVRVTDCIFDGPAQSAFRVQGDSARIFVDNSVFSRMGRPTDPTNGRFVDNRGVRIDSLVVTNSTIYNATHYFYRNSGGGTLEYGYFENNTFYNSALDGFDFGPVTELTFQNNIVANAVFAGAELEDDGSLDPRAQFAIDSVQGELSDIIIRNNNFYHNDDLIAALPTDTTDAGETIESLADMPFDSIAMAAITAGGYEATNISEPLEYRNAPPLPLTLLDDILSDTTSGSTILDASPWDMSGIEVYVPYTQNLGPDRYIEYHNFCYTGSGATASAGTDGGAIGDVDEGCDPVSVTNLARKWGYEIYPNPTNGRFTIEHGEGADRPTAVSIFNATGQLVWERPVDATRMTIDLQNQPVGTYFVRLHNKQGGSAVRALVIQQ